MFEKFVAHRGYQNTYPENTLIAFEQAVSAGARFVELDIQLSADKVAVIFHDPELERMTGEVGLIHETLWSDLQVLSAHEPERLGERFLGNKLSALSDMAIFLKQHPGVTCYLEVKAQNADYFSHEEILDAISSAMGKQLAQCFVISFDTKIIHSAFQAGWRRLGWVLTQWEQVKLALVDAPYLEVMFSDEKFIAMQDDVAGYPWEWVVYEVDEITRAQALWAKGVDKIETFCVKEMLKASV